MWDYKGPTGAGEELLDLLVLWHVLDGSVDLLSDNFYCTLPFQITVSSIQQPVCRHKIIQQHSYLWIWPHLIHLLQSTVGYSSA